MSQSMRANLGPLSGDLSQIEAYEADQRAKQEATPGRWIASKANRFGALSWVWDKWKYSISNSTKPITLPIRICTGALSSLIENLESKPVKLVTVRNYPLFTKKWSIPDSIMIHTKNKMKRKKSSKWIEQTITIWLTNLMNPKIY